MELLNSIPVDVRLQIAEELQKRHIKQSLLYKAIGCTNQHISGILSCKRVLTAENLRIINEVLGTNFKDDPPQINHAMRATG